MAKRDKERFDLMPGIKPGLISGKHRERMGPAIWPFLYLLTIPMMDGDDGILQSPRGHRFSRHELVLQMRETLHLKKATAYNLFNRLVDEGYLLQHDDGTWEIAKYQNFKMFFEQRRPSSLKNETDSLKDETESLKNETGLGSKRVHKNKNKKRGETPPKKKTSKGKTKDFRLRHSALKIYRQLAHLWPEHAVRDDMIECCDEVGREHWEWAVREWIARGYRKTNISGIIDVARHGFRDERHSGLSTEEHLAQMPDLMKE